MVHSVEETWSLWNKSIHYSLYAWVQTLQPNRTDNIATNSKWWRIHLMETSSPVCMKQWLCWIRTATKNFGAECRRWLKFQDTAQSFVAASFYSHNKLFHKRNLCKTFQLEPETCPVWCGLVCETRNPQLNCTQVHFIWINSKHGYFATVISTAQLWILSSYWRRVLETVSLYKSARTSVFVVLDNAGELEFIRIKRSRHRGTFSGMH